MTGETSVTGENRLFLRFERSKERTQAVDGWTDIESTKTKVHASVALAATKDGLVNLRCEKKNTDMFTTFSN